MTNADGLPGIPSEVEESFRGQRSDERPFDYAQSDNEYFRSNAFVSGKDKLDPLALLNELARHAVESVEQAGTPALLALFLVAALTEVGIPFPFVIDSALFFIAYRKGPLSIELALIMLFLLLGRIAGAGLIYWLARLLGAPFIQHFRRRSASFDRKLAWFTRKLARRASTAVTIGRLTPGLLTLTSIASGATSLAHYHFVAGIAFSSIAADGILVVLGTATKWGFSYFRLTPPVWMVAGIVMLFYLLWSLRQLWLRRQSRI